MGIKDKLAFAVNGRRFELSNVDPSTTLLEFLRTETPFKGAKLGCGEESESFLDDGMGLVPSKWKGICQNNTEARLLLSNPGLVVIHKLHASKFADFERP